MWASVLRATIGALLIAGCGRNGPNGSNDIRTPYPYLCMIVAAEEDYRAADRDGNGIADCWVGDVSGLYRQIGRDGNPIALIPERLAALDVDPAMRTDSRIKLLAH